MYGEFIYFVLAFLAGIFVKIVDNIEDESKRKEAPEKWPLAIAYGILIGYLISKAPFAMIFLGALCAQAIVRKLDTWTHRIGFTIAILFALYLGLPEFLLIPFAVFLIAASLDEFDKILFWNKPVWVQDFRPILKLVAIPFIFFGKWEYLAGILAFDVGYILIELLWKSHADVETKRTKKTVSSKKKKSKNREKKENLLKNKYA